MSLLSEAGLYDAIIFSDRDEAVAFREWVTDEVLPSIRKTGSYSLTDHGREAMPLPMDIAEAMATALKPMMEKVENLTALVEALMPKPEADRMLTAAAAAGRPDSKAKLVLSVRMDFAPDGCRRIVKLGILTE